MHNFGKVLLISFMLSLVGLSAWGAYQMEKMSHPVEASIPSTGQVISPSQDSYIDVIKTVGKHKVFYTYTVNVLSEDWNDPSRFHSNFNNAALQQGWYVDGMEETTEYGSFGNDKDVTWKIFVIVPTSELWYFERATIDMRKWLSENYRLGEPAMGPSDSSLAKIALVVNVVGDRHDGLMVAVVLTSIFGIIMLFAILITLAMWDESASNRFNTAAGSPESTDGDSES